MLAAPVSHCELPDHKYDCDNKDDSHEEIDGDDDGDTNIRDGSNI